MNRIGALEAAIRAAGTDNLGHFGNGYEREGGLALQQHPFEFATAIAFMQELFPSGPGSSWGYFEIGSASGGACRFICEQVGFSRAFAMDDRSHARAHEQDANFAALSAKFGLDVQRFYGDSHSPNAREWVRGVVQRVDLAFVDGDHSYDGCRADLEMVLPHARYVMLHDTVACEGVKRVWDEAIASGRIRAVLHVAGADRPLGIGIGEVVRPFDLRPASDGRALLSMIVTVKDEAIYQRDIIASTRDKAPLFELITVRNARSQASALNLGIEAATADLIVCPHQDIAFCPGWYSTLLGLVRDAPANWGVLGAAGTELGGKMFGTHSGLGMAGYRHQTVQTLDGSLLILRKSSGLRFDEQFDRFHAYDMDICLQAADRGMGVYAINLPIEHRTKWTAGGGFLESVAKVQAKWKPKVPVIYTTVGTY